LAAALLLTSCSREETSSTTDVATSAVESTTTTEVPEASSTTSTTPVVSTTTPTTIATPSSTTGTATSPTTSPTTSTTTAPAACPPVAALPVGIVETAAEPIDVDADGATDTVRSYAVSATPGAGDWHLRVELAAGGGADLTLPFDPLPAGVTVLGGTYVGSNVDPGPEGLRPMIFATIGAGASAAIVGLYRLSGCDLVVVQNTEFGAPAEFVVGASVMHTDGLRCEGVAGASLLVAVSTIYDDVAMEHEIVERAYTRDGDDLVLYADPIVTTSPALPTGGGLDTCGIDAI
jgi:hypothetical protein